MQKLTSNPLLNSASCTGGKFLLKKQTMPSLFSELLLSLDIQSKDVKKLGFLEHLYRAQISNHIEISYTLVYPRNGMYCGKIFRVEKMHIEPHYSRTKTSYPFYKI